jgi:hypothetical protein
VTPEDFDALFDSFHSTVVRLETLPAYSVGGAEAQRLAAFRAGEPRPERSVRTDPWLARIALTTIDGKSWSRVRIVDSPPTEYQRYQFASYRESQAVGERVSVIERADARYDGPDFWLFDAGTPHARAVVMRYDDTGRWLGAELVTDPEDVGAMARAVARVAADAEPFNVYLSRIEAPARA